MKNFEFPVNVLLDGNSASKNLTDLCEVKYLHNIFTYLRDNLDNFDTFQFYIFNLLGNYKKPLSKDVKHPKKVLIYISDETGSIPYDLVDSYFAIFKCYLPYHVNNTNIFPFPLGYVAEVPKLPYLEITEREIDVFFSGCLTGNRMSIYFCFHPFFRHIPTVFEKYLSFLMQKTGIVKFISSEIKGKINGLKYFIKFSKAFKSGLSPDEYAEYLNNSKFVLCPKGFINIETFRHLEALRSGAIVVTQNMPDLYFYRDAPFLIIKNYKDLTITLNKLASNQTLLKEKQRKSIEWYEKYFSEQAVADYMKKQLLNLQ